MKIIENIFRRSVEKIQQLLKYDKNNRYFTITLQLHRCKFRIKFHLIIIKIIIFIDNYADLLRDTNIRFRKGFLEQLHVMR
jgi:hypothetical protein